MSHEMFSDEAIYEMLKEAKRIKPKAEALGWEVSDIIAKMAEEVGEFSEACMIKQGRIRNKELKHPHDPFDEASDVMNCMLDAITRLYPEMPASQVYILFLYYVNKKCVKWIDGVEKDYEEYIVNGP